MKMVVLNISNESLTIVSNQEFLAFSLDTLKTNWTFNKVVHCLENIQIVSDLSIQCSTFSPCGQYFGLCFDRNIIIYSTNDWNVLYISLAERKASSLRFLPTMKALLLADKSGCVSFYSFQENKLEKSDLALGHNSMLTDALITEDGKFIITCDRDEKIRVTNYPNVYNIERYCLGHRMFVSCIHLLPNDKRVLISSSGDGTIRLWNFITGEELVVFDCNNVKNSDENSQITLTKIVSCKCGLGSLVAVLEYKSTLIRIFSIKGELNSGLNIELKEILNLDCIPWDIEFQNETLICLVPAKENSVVFWSLDDHQTTKTKECFKNIMQYLNNNWDSFIKTTQKISDIVPVLFKREVDNLKEYEQRKKARLLKTGKTS